MHNYAESCSAELYRINGWEIACLINPKSKAQMN